MRIVDKNNWNLKIYIFMGGHKGGPYIYCNNPQKPQKISF